MRWLAEYGERGQSSERHYRTVWADTITEAQSLARRFKRKDWLLLNVTSH